MSERIFIFDTTLRDGEQSPGATMNRNEKVRLARQLEILGVDIIEAGFPAASQGDFEAVRDIASAVQGCQVAGLCRALPADIDRAWEAVKVNPQGRIHTFLATSDIHMKYKLRKERHEVLDMAEAAVKYAVSKTSNVEFSAEDASRSDWEFLAQVFERVIAAGATTINVPDTVGYTQPQEFAELIKYLLANVKGSHKAVFSVHCHNDLGLATANTLAALKAGARQAEVTLSGIGERAGNAALEEVVMSMDVRKEFYQLTTNIKKEQIFPSTRLLSLIIGQPIPPYKSIIGANAFAHESGIHQDGVLKNRLTYEIMTPESVGRQEEDMVLGKHSGRAAFDKRLERPGLPPRRGAAGHCLHRHEEAGRPQEGDFRRRPRSRGPGRDLPHPGQVPPGIPERLERQHGHPQRGGQNVRGRRRTDTLGFRYRPHRCGLQHHQQGRGAKPQTGPLRRQRHHRRHRRPGRGDRQRKKTEKHRWAAHPTRTSSWPAPRRI
jgi:2-isopropylmalate synthase